MDPYGADFLEALRGWVKAWEVKKPEVGSRRVRHVIATALGILQVIERRDTPSA